MLHEGRSAATTDGCSKEDHASASPPSLAVSKLLADLAVHQQCLGRLSQDLDRALVATQGTVKSAQELLKDSTGHARPGPPPTVSIAPHPRQQTPIGADSSGEESLPVSSEWHHSVVMSSAAHQGAGLGARQADVVDVPRLTSAVQLPTGGPEVHEVACLESEAFEDGRRGSRRSSVASLLSIQYSEESWDLDESMVRRYAIVRLQERLGKTTLKGNVTAFQVYNAMSSMGVSTFTVDDIERWFAMLDRYGNDQSITWTTKALFRQTSATRKSGSSLSGDVNHSELPPCSTLRFRLFVETILDDDIILRMSADFQRMSFTIRELLLSGHANRLVAHVTRMSIEDVAAPLDKPDIIMRAEPLVALLIVCNGIFIGVQASISDREDLDGWFWGNIAFTVCMVFELCFRVVHAGGFLRFFRQADRWWNLYDCLLVVFAACDIALEVCNTSADVSSISVMRILRLTRLTRLVRLFRLHVLKELNLMISGLLGGLRTLFWAIALLFFTLYVIAVWATIMIGHTEASLDGLFTSVPASLFTCFRCYMGDCETSAGVPIIPMLAEVHGLPFILGYVASTLFIVFGLFNLIVAVYVENTLTAAKTDGRRTAEEIQIDNLNTARRTRQLLKKFCLAERLWTAKRNGEIDHRGMMKALRGSVFDDVQERSMEVSKEMYLCVIQDPQVQKIMDDMEIPPERAHLFDVIDADCSGGLEVGELITGLLRVRGEARKSDIVGTLLGIRAIQGMIREQNDRFVGLELQLDQLKGRESFAKRFNQSKGSMRSLKGSMRGSSEFRSGADDVKR